MFAIPLLKNVYNNNKHVNSFKSEVETTKTGIEELNWNTEYQYMNKDTARLQSHDNFVPN